MRKNFSNSKTGRRLVDIRSRAIIAFKKKYSARIKSVLIPNAKIYTGETRELLDESILIRATVKSPRDMRRLNVTNGNIKKSIQRRDKLKLTAQKKFQLRLTGRTSLSQSMCSQKGEIEIEFGNSIWF